MRYSERITIQLDYSTRIDAIIDYVIRRPAIPRWWDPVSRPHVALYLEQKTVITYLDVVRRIPMVVPFSKW
jgi:hypothetical protein